MKKAFLSVVCLLLFCVAAIAQITIKKDSSIKKMILPKTPPASAIPLYTLNSAKVNIRTGNDNKENGAGMIFFFREKDGIWGKGADLFQGGSKAELKVNSNFELPLEKVTSTTTSSFTLDNLQAKGLYFGVYYSPNFFSDAWKIEAITVTLEFKDQFGSLHSTFGNRIIQYNISSGLLTNSNWLLKATADGSFFTPSPVTVTNKF